MRRFGRRRWSVPVEAKGEARCCNPADWSHRAITASPASVVGPALCREPWSYRAVAAALLCCIWPPMWRCDRRCGANFSKSTDQFYKHNTRTHNSINSNPHTTTPDHIIIKRKLTKSTDQTEMYSHGKETTHQRVCPLIKIQIHMNQYSIDFNHRPNADNAIQSHKNVKRVLQIEKEN